MMAVLPLAGDSAPACGLDPSRAISQYVKAVWSTESGLPQSSVYSIAQTTDGYLWVGTEQGLSRFDGVRFTTFTHQNTAGLPANYVYRLLGARDGSLWVGTDSGLARLKNGVWSTFTQHSGLPDDDIEALAEGGDGSIWIGTGDGVGRFLNGKLSAWGVRDGLPGGRIASLRVDRSGTVWIAAQAGLARFDGSRLTQYTRRAGLPTDALSAMALSPDGDVWIGTAHGALARLHGDRIAVVPVHLPANDIRTMLFDRNGNLWLGFQKSGLARLHDGEVRLVSSENGLPGQVVESLFEDAEHNLWAGLFDGGLVELRDGAFSVYGPTEGLSGNLICCAVEAPDLSVWAPTGAGELDHILPDGSVRVYTERDGLAAEGIHSLLLGRDGALWIGQRHGVLSRFRNGRFTIFRDPAAKGVAVNGLLEDRAGTLWIGTYGAGLARLVNGRIEHVTTKGQIPALAEAPDGAIWIASDGDGVFRLQNGAWTHYTSADGLKNEHSQDLWIDGDGTVWVGLTGGLARIRNGRVTCYMEGDGLLDSAANLVEDRQGNLWMGSDHGVFTVSRHELDEFASGAINQVHSVGYDTSDGMRSRETMQGGTGAGSAGPDGRLFFPTLNGLAVIDPARVPDVKAEVPVRIESVMYGGQAVPVSGRVVLGPAIGRLAIQFTALTFVAPTRMRFRYKLDGFDRDWVTAGDNRVAEYTSLPPGRYIFRVQAARQNGTWGEHSEVLSFVVKRPWYNSWTAWLAYVGIASLFTWMVVEWRTRRLLHRRDELERMVADRTSQLEQEKAALAQAREKLQVQATHDSLTGVWNRAAILEHLERELKRAQRENHALTVILADLDHFKQVNDCHGHLCGDLVLFECAQRLALCLRAYDFIGRYGGEEFLILMPGWDASENPSRIEQLVASIGERPVHSDEREMHMTCSFGVTVFHPGRNPVPMEELIACADTALYGAKTEGRNRAKLLELVVK